MLSFKVFKNSFALDKDPKEIMAFSPRLYVLKAQSILSHVRPFLIDLAACLTHPIRTADYAIFVLSQRKHLRPAPSLFHDHLWQRPGMFSNSNYSLDIRICTTCCGIEGDKKDYDKFLLDESSKGVVGAPWEEVYGYLGPIRKH